MIKEISSKSTRILLLMAIVLFLIAGCSSRVATLPPPGTPVTKTGVMGSDQLTAKELTEHVKKRISVYESKLLEFTKRAQSIDSATNNPQLKTLSECRVKAYKMLNDYQKLYNRILMRASGNKALDNETIARVLGDDNEFIDGVCGQIATAYYSETDINQTEEARGQEQPETTVAEDYRSGLYEKAVSDYENMVFINGQPPSPEETILYGKSLLKIGRVPEALAVFEQHINKPDAVYLSEALQMAADISFALQQYDKANRYYDLLLREIANRGQKSNWARQQYSLLQNISNIPPNIINEYSHLLLNYLTYRPERDGFKVAIQARDIAEKLSYSPIFVNIKQIEQKSRTAAESWFNQIISQVNNLAETSKQQAIQIIEQLPLANLPIEKQKQIQELKNSLTEAEKVTKIETRKTTGNDSPEAIWQKAMINLDNGNYDLAMEQLEYLNSTPLAEKAQTQIKEVINLAAATERRKAARLFVQATKTEDVEKKKELLFASRDLLRDIATKYPEAEINVNGRLKKNLQMVENKLYEIDPKLLSTPRRIGDSLPYN